MCLKTENWYLKIFVKIRVGEKVYEMLFKNLKWLFENTNQTVSKVPYAKHQTSKGFERPDILESVYFTKNENFLLKIL